MSRPLSSEILAHVQDFNTSMRGRSAPGPKPAASKPGPGMRSFPCKDCPKVVTVPIKRGAPPERCDECRQTRLKAQKRDYNKTSNAHRANARALGPSDVGALAPARSPAAPRTTPAVAVAITLEDVARVVSEPGVISIAGKLQHHIHVGRRSYVGDTLPEAVGAAMEGEEW